MGSLIIVESPTKARTLSRFLGKDFRIEATMGHIRDLPQKKLGVEIKIQNPKSKIQNYKFIPQYQVIPDRKKRVLELKEIAGKSTGIILATDPDREGEAIAFHMREVLKRANPAKLKFHRIVFHEITESAILTSLKNPREIDMHLVDAQQARRILDRLVGYKLSPLLWNKLGKRWLSAGRVQSVAVKLIVDREREIESFKPVEYWLIEAELANQNKENFICRLSQIDGKKAEITNSGQAETLVSDLKKASYCVVKVDTKDVRRFPMPPFTTSTLSQTASNRFGWSAKRVMKIAQSLYEEGLITYHRTDSTNIAKEALVMARDYITNLYGGDYLPPSPKLYKTKSKVAQEAHEAIRPSIIQKNNLKILDPNLGRDADLLYSLIWKRFLASQMKEAVLEQNSADIEASMEVRRYILHAAGSRVKFDGWQILYGKNQNLEEKDNNEKEEVEQDLNLLPKLAVDELIDLIGVVPRQKFTQPLPRFTEASLIKALEEKGIGRPSTYAPIISTIQDRKYVEKVERKFKPTDLGRAVNDFLVLHFPQIFDEGFTARMEEELDEIANGKMEWNSVVSEFYQPFIGKLDKTFKEAERVRVDLGSIDEKCPDCGNPLAIRMSRFGKFIACTNFPKCKYTRNIIEKAGIKCPKCGGEIIIKKTKRGKQFYGCGNYPKCIFAAWKKEDIK